MSEADSKIFWQKRSVSEIKSALFCKSVHESANAIFPIKQNEVKIIYLKQIKGQL